MERFNYPSIRAVKEESVELLRLMKLVDTYGYVRDQQEETKRQNEEYEMKANQTSMGR